jgi:hypothetical protein
MSDARLHLAVLLLMLGFAAAAEPAPLRAGYADTHPRLLLAPADLTMLKERIVGQPEMWKPVLASASRLGAVGVPDAAMVREGKRYYRIDWLLSGALAGSIGDDAKARAVTIAWMKAHCQVDVWGTGWRENTDIPANWYMYHIALAYDLLHADITPVDRALIEQGLAAHAEAVYRAWKDEATIPYDQNHTYVPMIGLAAAALVLLDQEPRAAGWLAFARRVMDCCRAVLPEDGYYYEGTGYWEYAFHWHVRYADLIGRATGTDAFDLAMFARNHLFAAHLSLPGPPWLFDIGDTGNGTGKRTDKPQFGRKGMLHRMAAARRDPVAQGVAEHLRAAGGEWEDAGMQFLWYDPTLASEPVARLPTFHQFTDHGVVSWRSSWDADATVLLFKCGPPLGYAAEAKLAAMPAWRPNTGHAHPDIGMFWLYARGAYLATDTGYSGRKRTRDHNTILVDGQGMGADQSYWVYSGFPDRDIPYATWTGAKLEKVHLEPAYAYALADFSRVYDKALGGLSIRRHLIASADAVIILDDLAGDRPHVFTSMLHADSAFRTVAPGIVETASGPAVLRHHLLNPQECATADGPAMVTDYSKGPNGGVEVPRGFQFAIASPAPVQRQRFIQVLMPAVAGQAAAQAALQSLDERQLVIRLVPPAGPGRVITLDLAWQPGTPDGPVSSR